MKTPNNLRGVVDGARRMLSVLSFAFVGTLRGAIMQTHRTTLKSLMLFALVATLTTGCGDDADLTGLYEVTYHTYSADNCDVEGSAAVDPPYFRMEKSEFFGVSVFTFNGCESLDDPDCNELAQVTGSFTQPIDDGWKGIVSFSSGSGGNCSLGYMEGRAVLQDDGIRIETRRWSEQVQLPEAACDPDEAENRGKNMPCDGYEVIEGALVAE